MAKANTLSIVATVNTTSILDTLKELGTAIKAAADSSGVIDEKIKVLKDNKVQTLGDTRKDSNAKFLLDHFIALGVAKTTAKNYLSDVRYAMENNAPFTFNSARAKSKDAKPAKKGKGNNTAEKSDAEKMIDTLKNVWVLSDAAEDILIEVEAMMANNTPLIDAIAEVLKAHGEKLED
jgi:hypothetical protein